MAGRFFPPTRITLSLALLGLGVSCANATALFEAQPKPREFLLDQIEAARASGNQYLERNTLMRLIMIDPNPAYRIELLRLDQAASDADQKLGGATVDEICRTASPQICEEARAVLAESEAHVLGQFQQAKLLAIAGQFVKAVETIEEACGGAPKEIWNRIAYLELLLLIPERKDAALTELRAIKARTDGNRLLIRKAEAVLLKTEIADRETEIRAMIANKDRRAEGIAAVEKLLKDYPGHERSDFWATLRKKGYFWQYLFEARRAVDEKDYAKAEKLLQQAEANVTRDELFNVRLVQARIAIAKEDFDTARRIYQETLAETDIPEVKERLKELTELSFQKELLARINRLEDEKKYGEVIAALKPLVDAHPEDAYAHFRLARAYQALDQSDAALAVFAKVPKDKLQSNRWAFFYALVLTPVQKEWALAVLQGARDPDQKNREMQASLKKEILLFKIRRCYEAGDLACAASLLAQAKEKTPDVIAIEARLAKAAGDERRAVSLFESIAHEENFRRESLLEQANLLVGLNAQTEALAKLDALIAEDIPLTENQLLYAALLYRKAGSEPQSFVLIQKGLKDNPDSLNPKLFEAYSDALALRDEKEEALRFYKKTLFLKGLLTDAEADDGTLTALLLSPDTGSEKAEDKEASWLLYRIDKLYQSMVPTLTTGLAMTRASGTPGYSDQTYTTVIVNYTMPYRSGELSLQTDHVRIDNGSLNPGRWQSMIGTCFNKGCTGAHQDNDYGQSVAVAYRDDTWRWQIGTTPIGFHYSTILGSLGYRTSFEGHNLTATVYRKAKSQSLLAFGGQLDPSIANNQWFGGVTRNGVRVDYSHEFDPNNGVWANSSAEVIRGHNVKNNSSFTLMGGYYHRWINTPNFLWQTGTNAMYMHYANNQNFYTWGNGGYYSPQRYLSVGLNTEVRYRTPEWSFALAGGASIGQSRTKDSDRYKLKDRIGTAGGSLRDEIPDIDAVAAGKRSRNFGYSLEATVERRLSSRYVLGAQLNWRHSPDWHPVGGMIYLRYYFRPWNGDLPMAPKPPVPFREWGGS